MSSAKTITDEQLDAVLTHIARNSNNPIRDYVIVLLSFKGGLRVGEIAGLSWRDVVDATGQVAHVIEIPNNIAKKGSGRTLPMHPGVRAALIQLLKKSGPTVSAKAAIVQAHMGGRMKANTLTQFLRRIYVDFGFIGVSSHSGRRTFLTKAARQASEFGCSIRDVQSLAGHKDLDTTETYIDRSSRVGELVRAL